MGQADTASAIRAWALRRHLPEACLERWLAMPEAGRGALLSAAECLHLRTGQFTGALEMLEEVALREGETIASVLARGRFKRILEGTGSAPERARTFLYELRALRFPRLSQTMERLKTEIAALGLPRGIALVLPKDLSSDVLGIELTVRSGGELKTLVQAIERCEPGIVRIIELLGGGE
jgi:hypothetical protein